MLKALGEVNKDMLAALLKSTEVRRFAPGQPFAPGVRTWVPHNEVHFGVSGLRLFDFWQSPCYHELLAFKQQPIQLGLVERAGIAFLVYRLGLHPWSDVPFLFHAAAARDRPNLAATPAAEPVGVQIVVIDAGTGLIRGLRTGTLDDTCAHALRRAARAAYARPALGEDEVRARIGSVYQRHPTSEALAAYAPARMTLDVLPAAEMTAEPLVVEGVN